MNAKAEATAGTLPLFCGARSSPSNAVATRVIPTGLDSLDAALGGGLARGGVTLVAARDGVGVTSLFLEIALDAARRGYGVGVVSERLYQETVRRRLVCLAARINYHRTAAGLLDDDEVRALQACRAELPWRRLHILTGRRLTMAAIEEPLAAYRPQMCVVDMTLRAGTWRGTANDRMALAVGGLDALARRWQVALLVRHRLVGRNAALDLADMSGLAAACLMERPRYDADRGRCATLQVVRAQRAPCALEVPLSFDQRYFCFSDEAC